MALRRDIYWIPNWSDHHLGFGCRLTLKAWRQGYDVHVRTCDADAARRFSDQLRSLKAFVPHLCVTDGESLPAAIKVSIGAAAPLRTPKLLLCLGVVPESSVKCLRVAEVLSDEDEARAEAAGRLAAYREDKDEVIEHDVDLKTPPT